MQPFTRKNVCLIVTVCFEEPVIMATGLQVAVITRQMFVSVFSISSDLSPAKDSGEDLPNNSGLIRYCLCNAKKTWVAQPHTHSHPHQAAGIDVFFSRVEQR